MITFETGRKDRSGRGRQYAIIMHFPKLVYLDLQEKKCSRTLEKICFLYMLMVSPS